MAITLHFTEQVDPENDPEVGAAAQEIRQALVANDGAVIDLGVLVKVVNAAAAQAAANERKV